MASFDKAVLRLARAVFDRIEELLHLIGDDPLVQRALEADLGLPPGALDPGEARPDLGGISDYLDDVEPSHEKLLVVLEGLRNYVRFLIEVVDAAHDEDPSVVAEEVVHRLIQMTTTDLVKLHHPTLYAWMRVAGVIEQDLRLWLSESFAPEVAASVLTGEYPGVWRASFRRTYRRFRRDQAGVIDADPDEPQLGFEAFWPSDLLLVLHGAVMVFGKRLAESTGLLIDHFYGWELPPQARPAPCAPPPESTVSLADHIASRVSTLRITGTNIEGDRPSAILTQTALVDADGRRRWIIALRGTLDVSETVGTRERPFTLSARVDAADGLDVVIRFSDPDVDVHGPSNVGGVRITLEPAESVARGPALTLPRATGTRLELGEPSVELTVGADGFRVRGRARRSALVVAADDADAFVADVLRGRETRVEFDLGVTVDTRDGLYVDGGGRLATTIAVNRSIGGVTVHAVQLALAPVATGDGSEVALTATADLRVELGPVTAAVQQIGLTVEVGSRRGPAPPAGALPLLSSLLYLGQLGFRPPSGIGIVVDAGPVTGGGFLFHDAGQYAGVLELRIDAAKRDLSIKAVGLLTTRLPDGRSGFSLLVIASVEFDPALGPVLGISLAGLGLIVGVHRTLDADALRDGLRTRALDAILFPPDPVANAGRVVATVGSVFPPARGSHLLGLSLKLVFGTPPLVTAEIAVVRERGASRKWAVIGQLHAAAPRTTRRKILELHVDGAGIWDLDRGEFSLDARVYDSRLGPASLVGDVALRSRSGDDGYVVFSAGGFHPEFPVPDRFPRLDRFRISLVDSEHVRLALTAYLAIAPGANQLGADAELVVRYGGFSFELSIGFDALFGEDVRTRVDFDVDIKVKFRGVTFFGADVWGRFTGPHPSRVVGEWSVDLWLTSVGRSFDLGSDPPPPALEPVDPLPVLLAALADPHHWNSALPVRGRALVTVRPRPPREGVVPAHPKGSLDVRQAVVPLGVRLERFAGAPLARSRRFVITRVTLGRRPVAEPRQLRALFTAADFLDLTDDEKIARPSFESMLAGVVVAPTGWTFGGQDPAVPDASASSEMDFDEVVFTADGDEVRTGTVGTVSAPSMVHGVEFGPAARSPLSLTGAARFRVSAAGVRVVPQRYVVVRASDLGPAPFDEAATPRSYSEAHQALERHRAEVGRGARELRVVPAFHLAGAP